MVVSFLEFSIYKIMKLENTVNVISLSAIWFLFFSYIPACDGQGFYYVQCLVLDIYTHVFIAVTFTKDKLYLTEFVSEEWTKKM